MNRTCIWLNRVLAWVDRCGPPAIPYIGKAPYGYRNRPATHLELIYVLDKGVKDVAIGDQVVSIPPFHVALHNVHQGNFTPKIQQFFSWCVFLDVSGEEEFAELADIPFFCCAPLPPNEDVTTAYARLGGLCVRYGTGPLAYDVPGAAYNPTRAGTENPVGPVRVKAALLDLLALIIDGVSPGDDTPSHPDAVQRAIEYMGLHYRDRTIRLQDVSRAAGLSLDHFGRLFRHRMGETPMHHLKRIRVNQARYLLKNTDLLVEEVACDVGFSDPFHFSRTFSTATGMSPRAWRKQHT